MNSYSSRSRQIAGYQQAPVYFHAFSGLGQVGYQEDIQKITRAFPPCFTASSIIPYIEKSQNFARTVSTEGLSRFGGGAAPENIRRDLDADWNALQALKVRFQREGNKRYCNWLPATRADHEAVLRAIIKPYITASAIPGAQAVVAQATEQLKSDLASGTWTLGGILPDWLNLKVIGAIGLGLLGFYAYRRFKGEKEEEAPRPAPRPTPRPAAAACPPCPECPTVEYIPPSKPTTPAQP